MKKVIPLLILALLIFGCCSILPWSSSKDEFEMIPKTANAVVIIKPSSILNDTDLKSISSSEIDNELERVQETTGIDPQTIDRFILFFKLDSFNQQSLTYYGFIAKGAINKDRVLGKMRVDGTVNELNYDDRVMYEMSPNHTPQDKTYFYFINSNTLIGGSKEAVEDSVALDTGKGESIKSRPSLTKLYNELGRDSMFVLLVQSSSNINHELNREFASSINITALSHMDSIGLSLNKVEKNVALNMIILADDSAGANDISELLSNVLSIAKGMSNSSSSLGSLLEKISIAPTGNEVSVTFSSTFSKLKAAYNELSTPTTLDESGWHVCNNASVSYCPDYNRVYCDKFDPTEIDVRIAAAEAISKHPGAYSANQVLDIYDWVHENIIYQNVPVNLTYEPYAPQETLLTKSGDCKNQAVLIASMIEAIGGSARILMIPECNHAFAEVYIGDNSTKDRFVNVTFAHYATAPEVNWHTSKNDTEIWFPLDTAGGSYPGNTIEQCMNASQVFVLYNCNLHGWEWKAPDVTWMEYGPFKLYDQNLVIEPDTWHYFTYNVNTSKYDYCTYNIQITSKARLFDWYLIPATDYSNFKNGYSYHYFYHEEQIGWANYNFTTSQPDKFNIIIENSNVYYPMTVVTTINERCYKK